MCYKGNVIKHIVFDFGGVLLDLDGVHTGYPYDLAELFTIPIEQAQQLWSDNKTLLMTGKETPGAFLRRMKQELHSSVDPEAALLTWESRNTISEDRIDWELVDLIVELKKNYKIHMLTDQINLQNGATSWINKLEQHFDSIFRSYEQGFRKPNRESYDNLLTKINAVTNPSSVVFIDDAEMNVSAAQQLGINGVLYQFKNRDLLHTSFYRLGVAVSKSESE
jgi:HAD superfamily hydrolase (TIGR01509 family)